MTTRARPLLAAVLLAALLAAGCATPPPAPEPASVGSTPPAGRPTVVALIDSGVNPYHDAFRTSSGEVDFAAFAPNVTLVSPASSGSYADRLEADDAFWSSVEPYRLYGFRGTRLMAIVVSNDPQDRILDAQAHGTGTLGLVARDDPEAILVMIQVRGAFCTPPTSCLIDPSFARGVEWAADQPWIDVISVSAGIPASAYDPVHEDLQALKEATRVAAANGKVVVFGTGNTVGPSVTSAYAGPPWIITVGGASAAHKGEDVQQNRMVDVVANVTDLVALSRNASGYGWSSGTSLSAPVVAATISRAIHEARTQVGQAGGISGGALVEGTLPNGTLLRATSADFRAALNASALAWAPSEWKPVNASNPDPYRDIVLNASVPVVFGPAQIGWGYVHAGLGSELARRVIAGDLAPADPATAAYMQAYARSREAFWP